MQPDWWNNTGSTPGVCQNYVTARGTSAGVGSGTVEGRDPIGEAVGVVVAGRVQSALTHTIPYVLGCDRRIGTAGTGTSVAPATAGAAKAARRRAQRARQSAQGARLCFCRYSRQEQTERATGAQLLRGGNCATGTTVGFATSRAGQRAERRRRERRGGSRGGHHRERPAERSELRGRRRSRRARVSARARRRSARSDQLRRAPHGPNAEYWSR